MRVKTGTPGLDKLLKGGIPSQSTVLLYGTPGIGKSTFAAKFLHEGLRKKENVIYINSVDSPEAMLKKTKLHGIDFSPFKKNLIVIDAYSCKSSKKKQGKYGLASIGDITGLNIELRKAIENNKFKNGKIVIDSLTDFLLYANHKSVFKLLQILRSRARETNSVVIILVEEGIHSPQVISTLNFLTDGTIKMQLIEGKRAIRIERMVNTHHSLKWAEFEISSDTRICVREFFK